MMIIRKMCVFVILLSFISVPVHQADALIPFEISLPETAGKISGWIQKGVAFVQQQIRAISESKIGVGIGKGLKVLKKGKEWLQERVEEVRQVVAVVKAGSSMAYEVLVLTRNVVNDGERIVKATKGLDQAIKDLEEEAKINKELLDVKIAEAKENLAIMKLEHQTMKDKGVGLDETYSMFLEEKALEQAIKDMKVEKLMVDRELVQNIVRLRFVFTQEIKRLENHYKQSMARLKALKEQINSNTNQEEDKENLNIPATEIVDMAKEKYAIKDGEYDTIAKSEQRVENINKDIISFNIASINKANQFIASFDDPNNDSAANLGLAGTGEGKTEAVQPTIENVVMQIEIIKKIIELELQDLEMNLLDVIRRNFDHKILETETDKSLVVDMCKYKVKSTTSESKDNADNKKDQDSDSNSNNNSIGDTIF